MYKHELVQNLNKSALSLEL